MDWAGMNRTIRRWTPAISDETFGGVSKSDRLMFLCNRIAKKVVAKDPDVLLGMLAYADYTRPPLRETVHPNIVSRACSDHLQPRPFR